MAEDGSIALAMADEDLISVDGEQTRSLIARWRLGDERALDQLTQLVYANLRRLASSYMRRERAGQTLTPTSLVHEAYLRLAGSQLSFEDRAHFVAMAAREMRRVLVDRARARKRDKRGGGLEQVTLDVEHQITDGSQVDMLVIQDVLDRLEAFDARKAKLVDLICFGGLTSDEAAEVLGVSAPTILREWRLARAWLQSELAAAGSLANDPGSK